jgi:transposase
MLADEVDYVLGVDTHRDEHVVAVVTAPAGAVVAGSAASASSRGYRELLRLAERQAPGRRAWAIEGTGSYGAGFARFLAGRGEVVLELSRTPRAERRLRGKDDELDAVRTARAALASELLASPRAGEQREALRLLLVARRSAVDVRRAALTQLRAVIVTAPERLRQQLRGLPEGRLLDRCSRLRRSTAAADELATRLVLRSLAHRVRAATVEAAELEREIGAHVPVACTGAARRAGRRTDRRRPADRRLVTPGPAPLRSSLRPPRRRCTGPRLERPDGPPPAQPRR